jgi:uncharacterized protein (TIGR03118 family)
MLMKSIATLRLAVVILLVSSVPSLTFAQHYTQTNLVSDGFISTPVVDPNLKNPWGLARSTTSPWWVSDNNAGVSTLYTYTNTAGTVTLQPSKLVVTVPTPPTVTPPSAPTGVIYNGSSDFVVGTVTATGAPGPASFIFCTEDGTISGWNPGVNAAAVLKVNNSPEAVYKGCTTADVNGTRFLYVTNFRRARIEVYDTNFKEVRMSEEAFDDDRIPHGFAPFNVQNVGGSLFVTYAKQDSARHDNLAGDGLGYVDIYSPSGRLQARLDHGPWLNAPWGVVWAPRDFGEFSNRVLVGNFGSGQIAAYNGFDGKFIGLMKTYTDLATLTGEETLVIDGLWALTFGNSANGCPSTAPTAPASDVGLPKCGGAGPYNSLFFTAGPDGETHGLMGTLTAITAEQDGDEE